jgi:hypothetical protein
MVAAAQNFGARFTAGFARKALFFGSFQLTPSENEEAVRNLRRTVFSSQCRLIAGSLKRRVSSFILSGQREPRDGH